MTFEEFLKEARQPFRPNYRAWIDQEGFRCLYLRYGQRHIKGETIRGVLDIATVEAMHPGQGTFKAFIDFLKKEHPELPLYVENAIPRLGAGLLRMGFIEEVGTTLHPEIASNYFLPARSDGAPTGDMQSRQQKNQNRAQVAKQGA